MRLPGRENGSQGRRKPALSVNARTPTIRWDGSRIGVLLACLCGLAVGWFTVSGVLEPLSLSRAHAARALTSRLGSAPDEGATGAQTTGAPAEHEPVTAAPPAAGATMAPPPAIDVAPTGTPVLAALLDRSGPLAADGVGQLFMVVNDSGGYVLLRFLGGDAAPLKAKATPMETAATPRERGTFPGEGISPLWETVYRRKGAYATSVTVGGDGVLCAGLTGGIDCIDPEGGITHLEHELLTGIVSLARSDAGELWALRSAGGGTSGLQLVRALAAAGGTSDTLGGRADAAAADPSGRRTSGANDPSGRRAAGNGDRSGRPTAGAGNPIHSHPAIQVEPVLTLRQNVQGFAGNGLAVTPDGSAVLPVIENGVFRLLLVAPDGSFRRAGDYFSLSGAVATGSSGAIYTGGLKRPESLAEQRNPLDVVFGQHAGGSPVIVTRLPLAPDGAPTAQTLNSSSTAVSPASPASPTPPGSRLTGDMALGGDGILRLIRSEWVLMPGSPAVEMAALWQVNLEEPAPHRAGAIAFRIPSIGSLIDPRMGAAHYAGPVLVAPGYPLVIEGINFDGKDGARSVLIDGLPATIGSWTPGRIVVEVPQGARGGEVEVRVGIDRAFSDPEAMEVKTPQTPGWFQIGSREWQATLASHPAIHGYSAVITVEGTTERGENIQFQDTMDEPGLYVARLPNGVYIASYAAAYVESQVVFAGGMYQASQHVAVQVPEQIAVFEISDASPIAVWQPEMLASPQ